MIYAGRDNDGRIVVDIDSLRLGVCPGLRRADITPAEAEKLAHDLLVLACDHEANRAAYGDASDTEDHDRAVDDALADAEQAERDEAVANDNHPENDASGEPDFGG